MPKKRNPIKEILDIGYPVNSLNVQTVINLAESKLSIHDDYYQFHANKIVTELMKPMMKRMADCIAIKLKSFEQWMTDNDRTNCSVCVKVAIPSDLEDWVAEVMDVKTNLYTYGSFSIDHGKIIKDTTDPLTSEQK